MADELQTNLETYKIQLQQVEAALLAEPDNDGLQKLKIDLQEVINITKELLTSGITVPASQSGDEGHEDDLHVTAEEEDDDVTSAAAVSAKRTSGSGPSSEQKPVKDWKVGDKCMAVWSKNGQLYEAIIDGISEGKAAITFTGYNVTEINKLSQLKPHDESAAKKFLWEAKPKGKTQWQVEKEKRRQKALKKVQRLKQIEEEKEKEKNKWKEFNRKAVAKSFKGVKKASIFATSDKGTGKVGVGTCGTSGRPMTKFRHQDRHSSAAASKMNYSTY